MEILRAINNNPAGQTTSHVIFDVLMNKYGNSLYRFCRSLTYSKEDADDLYQDALLSAYKQLPKVSDSDNPQGFLFSSALYIWKSRKRKHARRNRLSPMVPLDETIESGDDVEEGYERKEEILFVRKVVNSLPDKYRIPIILYYTAEMNLSEIALTLELPVGTVKSRLFKAREMVKKGMVEIW